MRRTRRDALIVIGGTAFSLGSGCALSNPAQRAQPDDLPRIERGDVDPAAVINCLDEFAARGLELNSVMLWRGGGVVAEGWWRPYRPALPHMMHSAAKSFTGAGVGLAIADGLIALNDPVLKFFPGRVPRPSSNLEAMTIESLLTQTCGHAEGISGSAWRPITTSWVDEFFKVEVPFRPGEHFAYSSATSYMLSAIISQVSGKSLDAYLRPRLFEPLGMMDVQWDVGPEGINPGGNGLSVTTSDFLKLGVLHLQDGKWKGRQVLPGEWARAVGVPRHGNDYGYQWWVAPDGLGYFSAGKFGQFCYVFPRQNAVLTMTAGVADNAETREKMHQIALKHIPLMCPPSGSSALAGRRSELDAKLRDLRALPVFTPAGSLTAKRVDQRVYACDANADGVESLELRFGASSLDFVMTDKRGTHVVRNGLSDWLEGQTSITGGYLHHEYEPPIKRVVAAARWMTADRLEMTWQLIESGFRDKVVLTFEDNLVRYDRGVNVNSGPLNRPTITGRFT